MHTQAKNPKNFFSKIESKDNDFITPIQKEFIIPGKLQDATKSEIDKFVLSLEVSIPSYINRNPFYWTLDKFLGRYKSFKPQFNRTIKSELKVGFSSGLFYNLKCSHHKFKTNLHRLDEIEYRISNELESEFTGSGSFLTNPPSLRTRNKPKHLKRSKNNFKCIDYLFSSSSTGGLYLLPIRPESINLADKYIKVFFHYNDKKENEHKTQYIPINQGCFIDYSYIPKGCTHYVVKSPYPWLTYSLNLTESTISIEHTLAPFYFTK